MCDTTRHIPSHIWLPHSLSEAPSLDAYRGIAALMPNSNFIPATHIVGQFLDASGESFGVCLQAALGITLAGGPAVIDADVLVAGCFPPVLHHHICHLHVETLAARATGGDRRGSAFNVICAPTAWHTHANGVTTTASARFHVSST